MQQYFLSVLILKTFQVAFHFSSLGLLSSTQTFLVTRVQQFRPLSQSKFVPPEYWDIGRKKDQERPYLNHLGKNLQLLL